MVFFSDDLRDLPTIAAHMIGSVGVRQAETAKHEMKFRDGKRVRIKPVKG